MTHAFKKRTLFISGIICICSVFVLANTIRIGTNTLFSSGHWISGKMLLHRGVNGAVAYYVTRPALSGGILHLGAWNGYQEVFYKDSVFPNSVKFSFLLRRNAYVTFLFAENKGAYAGLRFSSNAAYDNAVMRVDAEGKFIDKQGISENILTSDVWHTADIRFSHDTCSVLLDNALYYQGSGSYSTVQKIGFRGSLHDSLIDNIVIVQNGSLPTIREHFDNRQSVVWDLIISLVCMSFINLILCSVSRKRLSANMTWDVMLKSNISFLIFLLALTVVVSITAGRYPTDPNKINWHGYEPHEDTEQEDLAAIRNGYNSVRDPEVKRIMVIGTSQTWGAGVTREQNTYAQRFEQLLNSQSEGQRYEVINAGIAGVDVSTLYQAYSSFFVQLKPDIMLLDVSNNDIDTETSSFQESLSEFAKLNRISGIQTIFILEPNTIENDIQSLLARHAVMERVAHQFGIPVIDMQKALSLHYDDGFLWWDAVHLTDFGNFLFAQELYSQFELIHL